jgi:hypothetical protein
MPTLLITIPPLLVSHLLQPADRGRHDGRSGEGLAVIGQVGKIAR